MQRSGGGFINLDETKKINVVPDIIIHRRKTRENLLAIEVKTSNVPGKIKFDHEKLRAYREDKTLRYRFTLFIRFQEPQEEGQFLAEFSLLGD